MGQTLSLIFGFACCLFAATASATNSWDTGVVIPEVATSNDPTQRYALYLPRGYLPSSATPLLIVLDPRGRAEAALAPFVAATESNGWIVMSSYGSRSDTLESVTLTALQALLVESRQRFTVAPRRLYLAGMSGTAKSLWTVLPVLQPTLGGLIGCSGGRPPELPPLRAMPPDFFGCAGTRDYNYQQMHELEQNLIKPGGNHRLDLFEGGHGWPPAAQLSGAIDWLELMAMRDGRTPRREDWIELQWHRAQAEANAEPDFYERWRKLDQLLRDFKGLRPEGTNAQALAQLSQNEAVKATVALEDSLVRDERRFVRSLDSWIIRINSGKFAEGQDQPPPALAQTVFDLKIRLLRKKMLTGPARESASAQRRLELAHSAANAYVPAMPGVRGDRVRLAACRALATAIFPERHAAQPGAAP